MRYCPKCGTANRGGSRFCNECGEELSTPTQIECPRCGTVNPIQNVLCSECSGRLPPVAASSPADATAPTPIKGLSLPTKNPTGEGDEEADALEPDAQTPAWLRELGARISEEADSDEADSLEDPGEVPDWLRDLRASLPEEPGKRMEPTEEEEALPDWLTAPKPTVTEAETDFPSTESEPIEFQGPAAEDEAEGEPPGLEAEEGEVPGWLSRLVPTAAPAGASTDEEETPRWLARLVPGESEDVREPAPGGEGTEEGMSPEWLADLQPTDAAAEAEVRTEAEAGLPEPEAEEGEGYDWLAVQQPVDEEAEPEATPGAAQPEEEEIPAWLADLQPEAEETETDTMHPAGEIEEGEIPDWMYELQPEDEGAEGGAVLSAPEIEEGEIPDWMAELQPKDEGAEGGAVLSAPEIEEGEIPDWMAELRAGADEAEAELMPTPVDIEEGEIPDWVAALRPSDEEMAAGMRASATGMGDEQLPDRVTELEPPAEELALAATQELSDEGGIESRDGEEAHRLPDEVEAALASSAVPAWLAELRTEAPEAAQSIVEENLVDGELPDWLVRSEIEPDESLEPAEIPGWLLALKPTELRTEGEEAEIPAPTISEEVEETGLLAGIQGVLPVEMLIAQPRAIAAFGLPEEALEDSAPARLFAKVVGRPPDAAPKEIVSPKADVLPATARWIIYAILLIVVALPIIIGKPLLLRTIEPTAATVDLYGVIESLGSGDPVLVAFDYDPASSGEMDMISKALLGHLMDKDAEVVVVSLLPAGPATAQTVLEELASNRPAYAGGYGERYANLGYLPGEVAGVRLLGLSMETALPRDFYGTPLSDLPIMQGLDSTQDFSLVIELAAAQDTLRWWIEQAGTPYGVPLGTGSSAAVIPFARPYYETESRQLVGMIGGMPDAVTYEALAGGQTGPTSSSAARLDSQLAGQILLILVILAGNLVYFSRRGTRRER